MLTNRDERTCQFPSCGRVFNREKTRKEVTEHICSDYKFKCYECTCKKKFQHSSSASRHCKDQENGFSCNRCGRTFSREAGRNGHQARCRFTSGTNDATGNQIEGAFASTATVFSNGAISDDYERSLTPDSTRSCEKTGDRSEVTPASETNALGNHHGGYLACDPNVWPGTTDHEVSKTLDPEGTSASETNAIENHHMHGARDPNVWPGTTDHEVSETLDPDTPALETSALENRHGIGGYAWDPNMWPDDLEFKKLFNEMSDLMVLYEETDRF